MPYGIIKVDTVTFTNDGVDKSVTLSGLVQNPTFSGNVTVTGTLSGVTVTGTTANFTSGNFTNISGGTHTITSGVFAAGSAASPSITFTGDLNTGIYSPGADQVAISTGGSGRLFVDASGNVRITSGSAWATADGNLQLSFSTNEAYATTHYDNHSITFGAGTSYKNKIRVSATGADNAITFHVGATSPNERMRITGAGLVGIGTTPLYGILTARAGTNCNFHIRTPSEVGSSGEGVAIDSLSDNAGSLRALFMRATEHVFLGSSSEHLRITSAGLVGIGTSSPSGRLTIANDSALNEIEFTGNDYTNVYSSTTQGFDIGISNGSSTGPLRLLTANTERLRITSAGNVGIGTTSPGNALHVNGSIQTGSTSHVIYSSNFGNYSSSSDLSLISGSASLVFKTGASDTERARIDTSGRLLVGTSSDLSGGVANTSFQLATSSGSGVSTLAQIYSFNSGGGVAALDLCRSKSTTLGTNTTVANNDYIGSLNFKGANGSSYLAAASVSCEIDGAVSGGGAADMPGRLVFSTTADGASSPTERMRIGNDGRVFVACTTSPSASVFGTMLSNDLLTEGNKSSVNTTSSNVHWVFFNPNGAVGSIATSGSSTVFSTSSDYRLKENVKPITDGITRLQQLKPSQFNFIADPDETVDGFIAHEVQTIVPEAITGEKDAVDDEGNPQYQGIDQSKLVPLLTAALQEAVAKIESLETRLTAAGL